MFATPSYFFFSSILGFEPLQGDALWRIAPAVIGVSDELTWANGSAWSVKGQLQSAWKLQTSRPWSLSINATVPLGLRALVVVPMAATRATASASQCTVLEAKDIVWRDRKYVPGVSGVVSAVETHTTARGKAVAVTLEGGEYELHMMCGKQ